MAVATAPLPYQSREQRLCALDRANEIRVYRARLKRDLKAGTKTLTGFIAVPPELLETMKVYDLLLALPATGKKKANSVLYRNQISPAKTVAGLSDRQREALLKWLGGR